MFGERTIRTRGGDVRNATLADRSGKMKTATTLTLMLLYVDTVCSMRNTQQRDYKDCQDSNTNFEEYVALGVLKNI